MKITNTLLFASAFAQPLEFKPVRRSSQEVFPQKSVTEPAPLDNVQQTAGDKLTSQASKVEEAPQVQEDNIEDYLSFLDDLPSEEWEKMFESLSNALEKLTGVSMEDFDQMNDEEFEKLLD